MSPAPDDAGSSLVELLTVMVLLGVVSALVGAVTVDLTRGTSHHAARVDTLENVQSALRTVARDLRAADPLVSATTTACESGRYTVASTSCANALVLDLNRASRRWRISYSLSDGALTRDRQEWTGSAWGAPSTSVLVRGLQNGAAPSSPVFALSDNAGQPVATVAQATRVGALLVARGQGKSPGSMPLRTEVSVRNRVYRTNG